MPTHLHVRILDGVETLCIGAVLAEAVRKPRSRHSLFPDVDRRAHPHLADALAANDLTIKELFDRHGAGELRVTELASYE